MATDNRLALPIPHPTRRQLIRGAAATIGGLTIRASEGRAAADDGIIRTAVAIHQEVAFKASPKRVYEALTDAQQFQKVALLSEAMKGMDLKSKPAEISREPGGTFALFAGYITGRQVELVPNQRIVQVWRAGSWGPGAYSIARFELTDQGAGTKLVFDHTGFPAGEAESLAAGWKGHYWEPLGKFLN